jgi:hypothetical protein
LTPPPPARLLAVYLNDHLAALVAARGLVERMLGATADTELTIFLEELRQDTAAGEEEIERLLRRLGSRASPLKRSLAWAGEKAARLKLNGSIRAPSPLSPVVELEGLKILLEYERSLWTALAQAAPEHTASSGDFAHRAERARQHLETAERLRLRAVDVALGQIGESEL